MQTLHTIQELAEMVEEWCDAAGVAPASGQAGERITERNIRYYRTLGLVDAPLSGGGRGYGEKHRLQLVAIRLLQAQGLPLNRIRDLLFGRTVEELRRMEAQGAAEVRAAASARFSPALDEHWAMAALDDEFLLVSRRGRGISADLRQRLLKVLRREQPQPRRPRGAHPQTKE